MPHKHTRPRNGNSKNFDLPPTSIAKPLAAFQQASKDKKKKEGAAPSNKLKRKKNASKADDTPRAFARLMQLQAGVRPRSGLDDGESRKSKKRKLADVQDTTVNKVESPSAPTVAKTLQIQPGERLADFNARVDQALPMGGLTRKGNVKIEGIKQRQTKTEKRLHKMYAEWREQDAKYKERLEEFQEEQEELADKNEVELGGQSIRFEESSRKKRKRMIGEVSGKDDDDPWAVLKKRREKPRGLNDIVQAPPAMQIVPKEKFKPRRDAKIET